MRCQEQYSNTIDGAIIFDVEQAKRTASFENVGTLSPGAGLLPKRCLSTKGRSYLVPAGASLKRLTTASMK